MAGLLENEWGLVSRFQVMVFCLDILLTIVFQNHLNIPNYIIMWDDYIYRIKRYLSVKLEMSHCVKSDTLIFYCQCPGKLLFIN